MAPSCLIQPPHSRTGCPILAHFSCSSHGTEQPPLEKRWLHAQVMKHQCAVSHFPGLHLVNDRYIACLDAIRIFDRRTTDSDVFYTISHPNLPTVHEEVSLFKRTTALTRTFVSPRISKTLSVPSRPVPHPHPPPKPTTKERHACL